MNEQQSTAKAWEGGGHTATDLTPEEALELFGPPVVPTPVDERELEWIMRYVETYGHQP